MRLIAKFNEEAFNIPTKLSISQDCSSKPSDVVCHLNFFCFLSNYLFYNKYLLEKLFTLESIAQAFFSGKPVKMILLPTVGEYIYACLEFSWCFSLVAFTCQTMFKSHLMHVNVRQFE